MTNLINDTATRSAANKIKDTLCHLRQQDAYSALEDAELAIISHRADMTGWLADIMRIIYGMPAGQALEAIRLARNAIAFQARLRDLFNGKIFANAVGAA